MTKHPRGQCAIAGPVEPETGSGSPSQEAKHRYGLLQLDAEHATGTAKKRMVADQVNAQLVALQALTRAATPYEKLIGGRTPTMSNGAGFELISRPGAGYEQTCRRNMTECFACRGRGSC